MAKLSDKRLWIVTGKGGVGKSAVSAALAVLSARSGRRTLVCEVNTEDRLGPLLEAPSVGSQISSLERNLWAVNVQPRDAMREYALMTLKLESIYNAVFDNRLVRTFLRFIPSLQELVMLGKILHHLEEPLPEGGFKYETIVLDAPATGHAISFLSVPRVLLQTVPPGRLSEEAQHMRQLLEDSALSAVILVALPEEMPVNETLELATALREKAHLQTILGVLNAYVPPRFSAADLGALSSTPSLRKLAENHLQQAAASAFFQKRLEQGLEVPLALVPRLARSPLGRAGVEEIAAALQSSVGPAP
jgi:anion-transporting  ArsA/GET3 family ATPase